MLTAILLINQQYRKLGIPHKQPMIWKPELARAGLPLYPCCAIIRENIGQNRTIHTKRHVSR
jgi:hypothetical protein